MEEAEGGGAEQEGPDGGEGVEEEEEEGADSDSDDDDVQITIGDITTAPSTNYNTPSYTRLGVGTTGNDRLLTEHGHVTVLNLQGLEVV